jgi:hypothetical protein
MNGVQVMQLICVYGSLIICTFCFILPLDLWFIESEVAGLALLFIPIMNGFGLLLFLTWIDLNRRTTLGLLLNVIVIAVTLFLSLEGVFEFTGINRAFAGVIQISLAILTPLMALINLYRLKRKKAM